MTDNPFMRVAEVAERMRCTPRTVRRWIKSGKLKATKPGMFPLIDPQDLRDFIQTSEVK